MEMKPATIDMEALPASLHPYVKNAQIFDSSCSKQAKTLFIKKDQGYFLKMAPAGSLADEAVMTEYFYKKGLSARVCEYISRDRDYLVTDRIDGQDGTSKQFLDQPEQLCDVFSESLRRLHEVEFSDCPRKDRTKAFHQEAVSVYQSGKYEESFFMYAGVKNADEAYRLMQELMPLSKEDTLLHGDYCLPNILLKEFNLSGFIDVGYGGAGDRHYDLFWGIWSLQYNLKTDKYRERFLDGYGREKIDKDRLKLNAVLAALS